MFSKKVLYIFIITFMVFSLVFININATAKERLELGVALSKSAIQSQNLVSESSSTRIYTSGLVVNTQSKSETLEFYRNYYIPPVEDIEWTGSHNSCDSGTTSDAYKAEIQLRINFFRAMAGIPADIQMTPLSNSLAQEAALLMSRNGMLDHFPPMTWDCYSASGAQGASSSNLFLGVNGVESIDGYIRDPGDNNGPVGHRRWILFPKTQEMGTGDIPPVGDFRKTNALRVFDTHYFDPRPITREEFVAWPPKGFVPYDIVYPRWSFSLDNADFTNTSVNMSLNGNTIPITIESRNGSSGENTIVWIPDNMESWDSWSRPLSDLTYTIKLEDVLIGGVTKNFEYDVIVFDPNPLDKKIYIPIIMKPIPQLIAGNTILSPSYTFDFDTDTLAPAQGADIWYRLDFSTTPPISTLSPYASPIRLIGQNSIGIDNCTNIEFSPSDVVQVENLNVGDYFCAKTDENNIVEFRIDNITSNPVNISISYSILR